MVNKINKEDPHLEGVKKAEIQLAAQTRLLELVCLNATDCSASNIFQQFEECLKTKGIPISNIIGMASDGANVMVGERNSFVSRLKFCIPNLIFIKCICHSSALVASKA